MKAPSAAMLIATLAVSTLAAQQISRTFAPSGVGLQAPACTIKSRSNWSIKQGIAFNKTSASSAGECCSLCQALQECKSFVFSEKPGPTNCHLKELSIPGEPSNNTVAGWKTPPGPAMPTPASGPSPAPVPPDTKGNHILFLFVDEMDGRILDPASQQVKPPLPNLKRLAAGGAQFTTCYAESPQCVPSRSSMMTGRRTHEIGVYDNFLGVASTAGDANNPDEYCVKAFGHDACVQAAIRQNVSGTWIDRLYNHGYNVTLYGKMHVGGGLSNYPGTLNEFPFNAGSGAKCEREWLRGLGSAIGLKGLKQRANSSVTVPDNVPAPAPTPDYHTIEACKADIEAGLLRGDAPQAQLLYCSILVPHPPYRSNQTYMKQIMDLDIKPPQWVPKPKVHPYDLWASQTKGMWDIDDVAPDIIRHFRRVYFSMCVEADSLLGELLDALDASPGARNRTNIVMISDHGEDATEHRQNGKNNMYESGSRVPMIISGPSVKKRGVQLTTLASLNDVFPTLMEMAQVPAPEGLAGSSLLPLLDDDDDAAAAALVARKDYITAQYHSVFSVTGNYMLRQGDFKLITFGDLQFEPNFKSQLFNLKDDPNELHDIAADNADKVKAMGALLAQEYDIQAADKGAKGVQRKLWQKYVYEKKGLGASGCQKHMKALYGQEFNSTDAQTVATWLGQPCN